MGELKPCPFCDGNDLFVTYFGEGDYQVVCHSNDGVCEATGPSSETEEEAIAAWNRRPEPVADDVESAAWAIHLTRFGDDGSHPSDDDYRMAHAAIDAMK